MADLDRNTVARSLHDLGLAAWFGGSLMGAVGVNGAAAEVDDPRQRARVANAGWSRWTPVNAAAIGAHLFGAATLLRADTDRIQAQKGVATTSGIKILLTAAALGVTAWSRFQGGKVIEAGDVPVAGGTDSTVGTPAEVQSAHSQLSLGQWLVPLSTGAIIVVSALAGEQQRPSEVKAGILQRLNPFA